MSSPTPAKSLVSHGYVSCSARSTFRSLRKTPLGRINTRKPTGSLRTNAEPGRPLLISRDWASTASRACPGPAA